MSTRTWRLSAAFSLAALSTGRFAGAEPASSPGPFVDFAIGAGYSAGKYTADGLAQQSSRSVTVAAPAIELTLTPGWSWSSVAVGPMFDLTVVDDEASLERQHVRPWYILSASVALLWRLRPQGFGPKAMVGLGYASGQAFVALTTDAIDVPQQTYGLEATGGPRLAARYGIEWPSGIGIAATVWGAYLLSEHAKYSSFGGGLLFTISSW